jgi:hypothetical protein
MFGQCTFVGEPPSSDSSIWRYMDLAKFMDLMTRQRLHFARADTLGDSFEGVVPRQYVIDSFASVEVDTGQVVPQKTIDEFHRILSHRYHNTPFVNCWHQNDHESVAMRELYSRGGVAIRSTVGRLCQSMTSHSYSQIFVGSVKYRDYSLDPFNILSSMEFILSKRKSFEHEREIRAVLSGRSSKSNELLEYPSTEKSHYVHVDLERLVERIYVAPGRPPWYRELIMELVNRVFGTPVHVETSNLDERSDVI